MPVLLLVSALTAGCEQLALWDPDYLLPAKRRATVREAAESYGENLRWGRYEVAAGLVASEIREEFLSIFLDAEPPYQFTSFELVSVELGSERDRAAVVAVFHMYRPPSLIELSVTERQDWRYEPAGSPKWILEPDLGAFRAYGPQAKAAAD